MRRPRKAKNRPMRVIRLWTYRQAEQAAPYLRSILQSLREHWLDSRSKRFSLEKLEKVPGRPDRATLLATETARHEVTAAEERFSDALDELARMDAFLLDPAAGVVLIPFNKDENLAWFVFDLFEKNGPKTWRLHEDPIEMRRPIEDDVKNAPEGTIEA